ncbi:hypothetical protein F7P69_20885 [Cellulosimicrobium funkei]|nr:hypothetical protein [Cellulosimicrobium funkei]
MSTHISSVSFTAYLPDKLGDMDAVTVHADQLDDHATTLDDTYQDTLTAWRTLDQYIAFDGEEAVNDAVASNCEGLGAAATKGLNDTATALRTFSSNVEGFKSTHTTLEDDVVAFNALHPYEYTWLEREVAIEDGHPKPSPTRTSAKRQALTSRLLTAQETYQGYIDDCVDAIKASSPAGLPLNKPPTVEAIATVKKAYNLATTWTGRAGNLRNYNGKLSFLWDFDQPTLSTFVSEGVPGWMKVHDDKSWLGKALPDDFKSSIPDFKNLDKYDFWKNLDAKYSGFLDGMQTVGTRYWDATLASLPVGLQKWLVNSKSKTGNHLNSNLVLDQKTGKYISTQSVTGKPMGPRMTKMVDKIEGLNLDKKLKNLQEGRFGQWVDKGGKALGLLDAGMTYVNSYTDNYNELLRENPDASEDEIAAMQRDAGVSTAIEGTAENAGKVVGGVVGRTAGAALGQAIIPIPGVGAAVGGFVGGIVGESVGGFIGKGVGGFIDDWRKDGFSGATEKAAENIGNAVENTGKAVGDAAKSVGKGVMKFLGWG